MTKAKPKPRKKSFEHLMNRPLEAAVCTRCNESVLYGYDGGLAVAVDPEWLTIPEEIQHVTRGRPVYNLIRLDSKVSYAELRTGSMYRFRAWEVVAGHWCTGKYEAPRVRVV